MTELAANSVIEALRERWRTQGILNERRATEEELTAFEARYNVVLPPDLRCYFATVNGTASGQYGMDDQDLLGFWHLDQVHPFAEESILLAIRDPRARHTFAFADYSIWCFGFGIQLSGDPTAATPVVADVEYAPAESCRILYGVYLAISARRRGRDLSHSVARLTNNSLACRLARRCSRRSRAAFCAPFTHRVRGFAVEHQVVRPPRPPYSA